jgi:hypothetical protein
VPCASQGGRAHYNTGDCKDQTSYRDDQEFNPEHKQPPKPSPTVLPRLRGAYLKRNDPDQELVLVVLSKRLYPHSRVIAIGGFGKPVEIVLWH